MLLRYIFCSNNLKGLAQDDCVTANLESLPCFAHLRLIVRSHFLCLCLPSLHHKLHRRHRSRIQKRSHNHRRLQFRTYSGICPHRNNSGAVKHSDKRRILQFLPAILFNCFRSRHRSRRSNYTHEKIWHLHLHSKRA